MKPPAGATAHPYIVMTAGSAPQLMALEIGSRLGHYDVTALIGEGGMGQVYSATDTKRTT